MKNVIKAFIFQRFGRKVFHYKSTYLPFLKNKMPSLACSSSKFFCNFSRDDKNPIDEESNRITVNCTY